MISSWKRALGMDKDRVTRIQELRRSNASARWVNKKAYSRKDKYKGFGE